MRALSGEAPRGVSPSLAAAVHAAAVAVYVECSWRNPGVARVAAGRESERPGDSALVRADAQNPGAGRGHGRYMERGASAMCSLLG